LRPSERLLQSVANLRHNSIVRTAFSALGFTVIYLYWILRPIEGAPQGDFYHWIGTANNFYTPFLLVILAVWLLFTTILLLTLKPGRARIAIWTFLLLCIPCIFIKLNIFYRRLDSEPVAFDSAIILTLLVAIFWRPSLEDRFERVLKPITTVFLFLGLLGGFIVCELCWYDVRGSLIVPNPPIHQRNAATALQQHRILWIVFDELSYHQTYEHRFPGLHLPAFDAIAASSSGFSHAIPVHIRTEEVLPGLFTGKSFDEMRDTFSTAPSFHNVATGHWQTFNQHDTVFQDALNAGYSTAVAGWYNPYCRSIPAVLDSCYWQYRAPWDTMLPSETTWFNTSVLAMQAARGIVTIAPARVRAYLARRVGEERKMLPLQRLSQAQDYELLQSHADQLLRDPSYSFVFLHLPVPHPYGFYERHTHQFTKDDSSYIDNLALADDCLSHIIHILKLSNQWNSSTIVLMGDHGWRTQQIWAHTFGWTKEDELASHGGQYDSRPVYLVKLPNQTTPAHIDIPFQTVNTRKLFDALMAHRINTPADLATWAQSTR